MQHTQTVDEFSESAWRVACETLADQAGNASGSSHGYYVGLFSAAIDEVVVEAFSAQHRHRALEIAREWDYATLSERNEGQRWNAEHGYCRRRASR